MSPAHDEDTSKMLKRLNVKRSMKQLRGVKQAPVPNTVEPRHALRARILALSLFPNIYNRSFLAKEIE
jgi:hypothetical protein